MTKIDTAAGSSIKYRNLQVVASALRLINDAWKRHGPLGAYSMGLPASRVRAGGVHFERLLNHFVSIWVASPRSGPARWP